MSAIKELGYGKIGSLEDIPPNKERAKEYKKLGSMLEKFKSTLTAEQKVELDKILEHGLMITATDRIDVYEYALSIGIGLGYESKKLLGEP